MTMNPQQLKNIIEASLLAADQPLNIERLCNLFLVDDDVSKDQVREALETLNQDYAQRSIELKEVSSGYRLQVSPDVAPWVGRLWEEKSTRYSRPLLETLALVVYRQPITRAEIEDIRGVSVSTYIIKTLLEREWVRVLGHREVPGRPALYGTTRQFLDYFNLKSLDDLPPLAELRDIDQIDLSINSEEGLTKDSDEGEGGESSDVQNLLPENAQVDAEVSLEEEVDSQSQDVALLTHIEDSDNEGQEEITHVETETKNEDEASSGTTPPPLSANG